MQVSFLHSAINQPTHFSESLSPFPTAKKAFLPIDKSVHCGSPRLVSSSALAADAGYFGCGLSACKLQHAARSTQISRTAASGIPRTCATCNVQHTHFQRVLYAILAHCFWGLRNKEGGKTRKRRCDCDASASVACHVAVASNAIKIMRQLPAARTGCLLSNCRSPIPIPNLEAAADPLVRLLRLLRRLCGMCGMMCVCGAETKGAFCAYVR